MFMPAPRSKNDNITLIYLVPRNVSFTNHMGKRWNGSHRVIASHWIFMGITVAKGAGRSYNISHIGV